MSPQPKAQAEDATATQNGDGTPETRPYDAMLTAIEQKDTDARSSAERQILRANTLEAERAELAKRITANRDYLRLMDDNEELSEEQGDWLDDFYPQKEKGERRSQEEIDRTRKVKEAARK